MSKLFSTILSGICFYFWKSGKEKKMSLKDSVTILKDSYEVTTFRLDHFLLFFVHKLSRILLSSFFFKLYSVLWGFDTISSRFLNVYQKLVDWLGIWKDFALSSDRKATNPIFPLWNPHRFCCCCCYWRFSLRRENDVKAQGCGIDCTINWG